MNMDPEKTIIIPVKLDEKTFKKFARFDMFILRKKWIRPAAFSLIMIAFSIVALLTRKEQSRMIAAVLLAVGLGLPLVYLGSFLSQVNMQAVKQKLKPARSVYTVTLRKAGIRVENNRKKKEDLLKMDWSAVRKAFRKKDCIYLYVTASKAFLLPNGQADVPDWEVWDYLKQHLGTDKCQS